MLIVTKHLTQTYSNFHFQDPNFEVKRKKGRPRILKPRSELKNAHVSRSKSKWTLLAVEAINKSKAREDGYSMVS